jgi:hypothetical protein
MGKRLAEVQSGDSSPLLRQHSQVVVAVQESQAQSQRDAHAAAKFNANYMYSFPTSCHAVSEDYTWVHGGCFGGAQETLKIPPRRYLKTVDETGVVWRQQNSGDNVSRKRARGQT